MREGAGIMSADNWTECPNCKTAFLSKQGGVETPLREDYEFYLEGFILDCRYSGCCQDCGFKFKFKKSIDTRTGKEVEEQE